MSKMGFIDIEGNVVIPPIYDSVHSFSQGYSCVKLKDKYYYITTEGAGIDPGDYSYCASFIGEYALVRDRNDRVGYIDRSFRLVIPCQYGGKSQGFHGGNAVVEHRGSHSVIDEHGNILLEDRQIIGAFFDGMAIEQKEDKQGFIDISGETVIPHEWDMVTNFREGLASVSRNGLWGTIDRSGRIVVEPTYSMLLGYSEGLAVFNQTLKGNKQGYLDASGQTAVGPQYADAKPFTEGMAAVRSKEHYGYIDKEGHTVIDFLFDDANPFRNGYANVLFEGAWALTDTSGNLRKYPQYSWVGEYHNGFMAIIGK